jgi:hypothetical protein
MEKIKKILPFFLYSCKKVTELINKKEIVALSFREKFILLYHNAICRTCTHYKKQSDIIENTFHNTFNVDDKNVKLSELAKEKILSDLKKQI